MKALSTRCRLQPAEELKAATVMVVNTWWTDYVESCDLKNPEHCVCAWAM
jgi:hypothetical protein